MAESLGIELPWPGWQAVRRIGGGACGSVWEIRREVEGYSERGVLKVIAIPREGDAAEISLGYSEGTLTESCGREADKVLGEYRIIVELSGHPNIVSCQDFARVRQPSGPGWYVLIRMELLEPLPVWLAEHPADAHTAARVGCDIAMALAACEEEGIVHRDVKPQNIFADRWGNFKLGDFGIARTMEGTRTATMAGTATYMTPEVAGGRYNQTVDIYSLGLVVWWMLDGYRLPFMPEGMPSAGDIARAEAKRLAGEPIPAPAGCLPALSPIVLKACAYKPENRYQSAREMAADLDAFLAGGSRAEPKNADVPVVPTQTHDAPPSLEKTAPGRLRLGRDPGRNRRAWIRCRPCRFQQREDRCVLSSRREQEGPIKVEIQDVDVS